MQSVLAALKKDVRVRQASQAITDAEQQGMLPRVRRDGEGWAVEDVETGAVVRVSKREQAISMAFGHLDEQEQVRAQAAAQLWDEIYERGGNGAEILRAEAAGMDTRKLAARSPEDAGSVRKGVETFAKLHGLSAEEAQKIVYDVMGFNRDETVEGVRAAVSSVFGRGVNVGTVLHEVTHGRVRAAMKSGRLTRERGLAWVRNVTTNSRE